MTHPTIILQLFSVPVRETTASRSGTEEEGAEVGILPPGSTCSDKKASKGNVNVFKYFIYSGIEPAFAVKKITFNAAQIIAFPKAGWTAFINNIVCKWSISFH